MTEVIAVEPPTPFEKCEICPAQALVAVRWPVSNPELDGRLVFCGHHFDGLHADVKAKCQVIFDTRPVYH